MKTLLLADPLSAASRGQLEVWLSASRTGAARLRAGFPPGWRAGDKTGTGNGGATNDVAIAWPPGRSAVLVAAYLSGSSAPLAAREAALAEVGRLAATDPGGWVRSSDCRQDLLQVQPVGAGVVHRCLGRSPIWQHSTMMGPLKPAALSFLNTPAKSTLPVPNWIMTLLFGAAQSLAQKPVTCSAIGSSSATGSLPV